MVGGFICREELLKDSVSKIILISMVNGLVGDDPNAFHQWMLTLKKVIGSSPLLSLILMLFIFYIDMLKLIPMDTLHTSTTLPLLLILKTPPRGVCCSFLGQHFGRIFQFFFLMLIISIRRYVGLKAS
ncbi:hypothetical protein SUGI_0949910 [Cryptomeria japonica]|nr:hypothetical protein SUGI_0949910 [Cryptomeria japonica]